MTPEISLQIPVRNGGAGFGRCLSSLAAQDMRGLPWELVIVDDGSTIPVEREFDIDLPGTVSVRIVRLEGDGNRPGARNAGWKACSSPLSMLSDGDIMFPGGILMAHVQAHRGGRRDVVMGARVNAWTDDASPWQKWFDSRGMGSRPEGAFPARYFVTGNLSIRTPLLEEAGGFDPAIDRYGGEDTEFGLRLAGLDPVLHWDPGLRVYHLDSVTVREHSRKMVEYGGSGLRYTLEKHPEARGILGSDWIGPLFAGPASPGTVMMRLLARMTLQPLLYGLVLRWMERFGRPAFLFTYLSVGGCLLGLKGEDFERH